MFIAKRSFLNFKRAKLLFLPVPNGESNDYRMMKTSTITCGNGINMEMDSENCLDCKNIHDLELDFDRGSRFYFANCAIKMHLPYYVILVAEMILPLHKKDILLISVHENSLQ